ncbi:MAG: amidohydrolase [Gaiellaceae bacterium]
MRADLVLTGGRVHPVAPGIPDGEAVAITGGRIVALGGAADIAELAGPATEVVNLDGGLVLPGFQDAHIHLAGSGLELLQCDLNESTSPEGHLETIARYAAEHPDEWIVGGGWSMDDFGGPMPTRQLLDAAVPGRAVALTTRDAHSLWASTRAFELAGIGAGTPDPPGGVIEREPDGTPAGTVHELAIRLFEKVLPEPSQSDRDEGFRLAQAIMLGLGITACQEANAWPAIVGTYLRAAERDELVLRLEGNLAWDPERGLEQLAELVERREAARAGRMRMRGAKLFQDGVMENFTAGMLEPYLGPDGTPTDNTGLSLYAPEELRRIVTALDAEGFQVHVHALGERAVRESLDAIEAALATNGARDARHHLAHLQIVHPDDLTRFQPLGVVANVTPYWAILSGYVADLTLPFVSEEAGRRMYPFGSLHRAGARLAFGSDWSVSTPDPLLQLEVAVERRLPEEPEAPPLLPDERLGLRTAIATATLGSAYVNGLDDVTGTIEPGKLADLVVLRDDILAPDGPSPAGTRVVFTLVEGEIVHDARA